VFGETMATIMMPNGTYLRYRNLREELDKETGRVAYVYDKLTGRAFLKNYIYGGKLVENYTQALAFAILKEQAQRLAARGVPIKLNVHDEWVTCVSIKHAATVVQLFAEEMRRPPVWCPDMPLNCEIDVGVSYGGTLTLEGR
jgi:DNA polymerase